MSPVRDRAKDLIYSVKISGSKNTLKTILKIGAILGVIWLGVQYILLPLQSYTSILSAGNYIPLGYIKNTLSNFGSTIYKTIDMIFNPWKYVVTDPEASADEQQYEYEYLLELRPAISSLDLPLDYYNGSSINKDILRKNGAQDLVFTLKYAQKEGTTFKFECGVDPDESRCFISKEGTILATTTVNPENLVTGPIQTAAITCKVIPNDINLDVMGCEKVAYLGIYLNATFNASSSTEYKSLVVPQSVMNKAIQKEMRIYDYLKIDEYQYDRAEYLGMDMSYVGISRIGDEYPIVIPEGSKNVRVTYIIGFKDNYQPYNGKLQKINLVRIMLPDFIGIYDTKNQECSYDNVNNVKVNLTPYNVEFECKKEGMYFICQNTKPIDYEILKRMDDNGKHILILPLCINITEVNDLLKNREFLDLPISVQYNYTYSLISKAGIRYIDLSTNEDQ